jgi:hypothetical protein
MFGGVGVHHPLTNTALVRSLFYFIAYTNKQLISLLLIDFKIIKIDSSFILISLPTISVRVTATESVTFIYHV